MYKRIGFKDRVLEPLCCIVGLVVSVEVAQCSTRFNCGSDSVRVAHHSKTKHFLTDELLTDTNKIRCRLYTGCCTRSTGIWLLEGKKTADSCKDTLTNMLYFDKPLHGLQCELEKIVLSPKDRKPHME